jgi:two-component system sensor kinase FixL
MSAHSPKETAPQRASEDETVQLEAIFHMAVDGIITIDENGHIEMVNPAACRMFGYPARAMQGRNISMLMPEPHRSQHDQYLERYKNTGNARIIGIGREVYGKRQDGSFIPLRLSVSEVRINGRRVFVGLLHDISELKQQESQLRHYAQELERSNRELREFAYVSSHDLQEPLRKIQAFGDRLYHREFDQLSGRGKDYLQRMLNAAQRMSNLINDLLSYSRVTSKGNPFEKLDLNRVAREVLSDLEIKIEKLQADIHCDELPQIEADPTQMRQLFQNLIGNSLKFTQQGSKTQVRIWAEVIGEDEQKGIPRATLYFRDNGMGFDTKYKERIFTIFQRLEGAKYEGSGIGLSICKRIVDRHHGDIDVESAPGQGTTFSVTLPIFQKTPYHNDQEAF